MKEPNELGSGGMKLTFPFNSLSVLALMHLQGEQNELGQGGTTLSLLVEGCEFDSSQGVIPPFIGALSLPSKEVLPRTKYSTSYQQKYTHPIQLKIKV